MEINTIFLKFKLLLDQFPSWETLGKKKGNIINLLEYAIIKIVNENEQVG